MEENRFKRVDKENDRKLKYEGFCTKCNKTTFHRFDESSMYIDRFKCMKCKTINKQERKLYK